MLHLKEIRLKSDQFPTKDHYPFNLNVLCKTPKITFSSPVTFFVATHSPILLSCPGSEIYSFDYVPVKAVSYEETNHYQIYKNFMKDPKKYDKDPI
jgi:hypothetical protein